MGLFQTIFGGSTSKSSNKAYNTINQQFSPLLGYAQEGASGLASLLGGDATGLNRYMDVMGFDPMAETLSRGITGNAAAAGLLRSGSTATRLMNKGQELKSMFGNSYIQNLLGLSNLGVNAGQHLVGAGNQSSSSQSPGIGGLLGQVAGGIGISDPRLKMNVFKLAELDDGLGVYSFSYI